MRPQVRPLLLTVGLAAFLLAGLSIVDMYLPRPYDGVVLQADAPGRLLVRHVVHGSGAARAGLRPGDQIVGIDRNVLRSTAHAAAILNQHQIGESVPYFVRGSHGVREAWVELGRRQIGNLTYLVGCLLGFAFFLIGSLVLNRQPRLRAAQVFFVLSVLFLLFLVCRLRPASYSWVDSLVLTTGTAALLLLPACFLHFFLIFPRPVRLRPVEGAPDYRRRRRFWVSLLAVLYLLPPMVLGSSLWIGAYQERPRELISGAPVENWWTLAVYLLVGLAVLASQALRLDEPRLRSGVILVFFGALFGLLPFLLTIVFRPAALDSGEFLLLGLAPLALVPITFAWAIVRFQLLDIRVILRKSLLYTLTTAAVTAVYALGIALFQRLTSGTELAASPFFPLVFALVIVLLFEPLRRRIQSLLQRFYFAERTLLENEIQEIRDVLLSQREIRPALQSLVERLPRMLGLHFAALYQERGGILERAAGPATLPDTLAPSPAARQALERRGGLAPVEALRRAFRGGAEPTEIDRMSEAGVELVGALSTPRRAIGWLALSGKTGQFSFDPAELDLLRALVRQTALALETGLLLEERTQQVEIERELEIAAAVQSELLPESLSFGPGWQVAAACRPARHVGGDFFTQLPGPRPDSIALVYGDVAGKSVAGALVMMAAHEALHTLALSDRDPERLFNLANQRLYGIGRHKSFVALAYLASSDEGLDYLLAGQPQPLLRRQSGEVIELPLPENRLPLGALVNGSYRLCHAPVAPGDLLLGYSDGVIDARSPAGEVFGGERLEAVVRAAEGGPEQLLDSVLRSLKEFTRDSDPYDDVTLVAIQRDREDPIHA